MIIVKTTLEEMPATCVICPYLRKHFAVLGNKSKLEQGDICALTNRAAKGAELKAFEVGMRPDSCPLTEFEPSSNS